MKTKIGFLLLCCSALASTPGLAHAAGPSAAPAAAGSVEQAKLASLGAQDPSLLKQSAGDRVVVEERVEERPRGWGRGRGYGFGGLLVLVLVIVLVVLLVG
jgi:hypothetical protein